VSASSAGGETMRKLTCRWCNFSCWTWYRFYVHIERGCDKDYLIALATSWGGYDEQ